MKLQILDPVDVQIVEATTEELQWLKDLLSYKAVFYIRKQYKSKRKEYRKSFVFGTKKDGRFFPTGFIPRVVKSAGISNIDLEVEGLPNQDRLVLTSEVQVPGIKLRKDQIRLVNSAIEHQRGVLVSPTGSGKTIVLMALLSAFPDKKVLVITHSKDIVSQTMDELISHGFKSVGTVKNNIMIAKIVVTTRQSLAENAKNTEDSPVKKKKVLPKIKPQHKEWMRDLGILVIDECFAKGTFISTSTGEMPIELVCVGDVVLTPNGEFQVRNVFQNKVALGRVAKVTLSNGRIIFCSKEHEFKTELGWVPIKDACGLTTTGIPLITKPHNGEYYGTPKNSRCCQDLHCLQKRILCKSSLCKICKISYSLFSLLFRPIKKDARNIHNTMSTLWGFCRGPLGETLSTEILWEHLHKPSEPRKVSAWIRQGQGSNIKAHERKQSHAQSYNPKENGGYKKTEWNVERLAWGTWWKWKDNNPPRNIIQSIIGGVETGICCAVGNAWQWLPKQLQSRFRFVGYKISNRSRWEGAQHEKSKSKGQEKRSEVGRTWVEGVEIYKPGSNDAAFESVIGNKERSQNFVELYDLEVETDHSYFANGVLVHNCHLGGNSTGQYNAILRSTLAPMRIGLTATKPDEEQIAMTLEGMLGPTIDEVTFEEGEELGITAKVKLELIPVPYRTSISNLENYKDYLRVALVENRARNRLIILKAKELVENGMSVLIFINNVKPPLAHGDHLMEMAELLELETVLLKGSTETEVRDEVKKEVINRNIHCVITSKIWKEGVNIPNLGAVILGGGGKSKLSTVQSIGRGLRKVEGKEHAVIVDMLDPYKYLAGHSIQRLGVYIQQGWL